MPSGTLVDLEAVWGSSASDVFAVGHHGTILRFDGSTWQPMASGSPQALEAVWSSSGNDIFAVGQSGTILHYDGSAWQPMPAGTTEHLYSVGGSSASDVYAVGDHGTILRYDGNMWQPLSRFEVAEIRAADVAICPSDLWGVWATKDHAFAVGRAGLILHRGCPGTACP